MQTIKNETTAANVTTHTESGDFVAEGEGAGRRLSDSKKLEHMVYSNSLVEYYYYI